MKNREKMADVNDKVLLHWKLPDEQGKVHVERIKKIEPKPCYEFIKRLFDISLSLFAIAVLLLPMAVLSIIIIVDSPGNPIYSQVRLGKNEKPFVLYKFRSMRIDAERYGLQWAEDDDPRVTHIGKIIRKTRMDELPQLWNIFCGEMSFVGPRPERPEFYELFDTYIDGFRQRMVVKPGLTGLAQINGGYDLKPEEKIVYDLKYIQTRSLELDIVCILKTALVVLTRSGAR